MAKPLTVAPPWGTAGFYAPQNYQDPLPWGAANPLGGGAVPWQGASRLNAAGLATFAANGFTPEIPTQAESFNEWLRQAQDSLQWVQDGSSADDADAHIVETTALGKVCVQAAELTLGVFGVGGDPVILGNGAFLPATKDLELEGGSTVTGGLGVVVAFDDDMDVTIGADAVITIGSNTIVTTGNNSTIDMVDNASTLITGTVQCLESSPLFAAGVISWDGRALALGVGPSAPRLAQPIYSNILGPITTGAGATPTGASVTLQMRTGERAKVVMAAAVKSDLVGNNIVTRLEANAVLLGNNERSYEPSGAGASSVFINRSELYTHAAADGAVTFAAIYGALAGNTTATSISVTAIHI